jgi:hypothetical protein
MGLTPLLQEPNLTAEQASLMDAFLEATGYGNDDLLAYNFDTQVFLTRNGGKYQVDGESIKHLAGPAPDVSDRWLD